MAKEKIASLDEIKRLKGILEDLESYIEQFTSFLPISVITISPVGVVININETFEKISNFESLEVTGELFVRFFREKDEIEAMIERASKGEVVKKEVTLITKEKKGIPVILFMGLRKSDEGNFIGYFAALIEIIEKKKMEEEVKERTKILEDSQKALLNILDDVATERKKAEEERDKTLSIITNFADGLLVFDREGKISLINPQAEDFFVVKGEEIIGKSIIELDIFPTIKPVVTLVGKEIKGVFRKEIQIKENLVLEVSTIPIMREEERLGTLIILHDVTREKMIERMKTEFVSLSAHQLRTPLSAIKWTLRMLLDGDLGKITEEQKDFIEKTYKSNERMINLINDLLDVTRIEEGRYLYKPILTQIEPIVQFVINSYKEEVERKNLKLEFKKPEKKLPRVKVDVEKIRLAIQNLLDNAIKYTPVGGEVVVSLKQVKKEIEFSIKDTGIGIPKDQQERVFTKFFRGANIIRMATEGTGLGLFITKNIIEAHGGKIWFKSREGKGTTFYFTLPIKAEFEEFLREL